MPKINILQGKVFVVASYVKPELYEIAKAHGCIDIDGMVLVRAKHRTFVKGATSVFDLKTGKEYSMEAK